MQKHKVKYSVETGAMVVAWLIGIWAILWIIGLWN
jgi:hypothetical protein